jgi:PPOX class probable F420-dependent enzyme
LKAARVARLATIGTKAQPHVVPVCFAYDGRAFYIALDAKPKRVGPARLARVRNLQVNPNVALLLDGYREDWSRLWYILVRGRAALLPRSKRPEYREAVRRLKAKYPQYRRGFLPAGAPLIRILPRKVTSWGKL